MKKLFLVFLVLMSLLIIGCGREEKKLRNENEVLKAKVVDLEREIAKLKETAEFHYQQGVDFLKENKFQEAKAKFEAVVGKYPTSPWVNSANQELEKVNREIEKVEAIKLAEEKRRQEEEQYRPKEVDEAITEWNTFRTEPDRYKDAITTWRLKVFHMSDVIIQTLGTIGTVGFVWAQLETPERSYKSYYVHVFGPGGYTPGQSIKNQASLLGYNELVALGKAPRVSKDDWIVVTGKFVGVSDGGDIILKATRIKNEGYKGK